MYSLGKGVIGGAMAPFLVYEQLEAIGSCVVTMQNAQHFIEKLTVIDKDGRNIVLKSTVIRIILDKKNEIVYYNHSYIKLTSIAEI